MKKTVSILLTLILVVTVFAGCESKENAKNTLSEYPDAKIIKLNGDTATLNGAEVEKFDYTWHCDPSVAHDEVENAPAEYYTGTKPQTKSAVYIDSELYYYPLLDESKFQLKKYDGENEWVYYYNDGVHNEYIFATLPALGNSLPTQMMHSPEEASKNKVLHITQPGVYSLEGNWNGQISVNLGDEDEIFTNPEAKVTLLLNGADITCTVAPGIVFDSVYECDNEWEEREEHSEKVDTSEAGANVVLVENTENNVSGMNIYRMLKTVYKDENSTDEPKVQKKMRKIDAAFYSYMSMNISGEGSLSITSGFEGLDSELHLTLNSGNITVNSQDDGINVNEDNVSILTINGGDITLNAANGAEGDGIDSNGYVVVNGGTLNINGVTPPDSAIDSEDGIYYNSGKILIDGTEQNYTPGSNFRETGGQGGFGGMGDKGFGEKPEMFGDTEFDLEEFKKQVAALDENATREDVLDLLGMSGLKNEMHGEGSFNDIPEGGGGNFTEMPNPPEKPLF